MSTEESNNDYLEILKKSFDTVGPIHPIVVDSKTGETVTGRSREKTGRPWKKQYIEFKNPLEIALFQAAENLNRRNIEPEENRKLIENIQNANFKLTGKYFTQSEISEKVQRSTSWISLYWNPDWTHPNVSNKKPGVEYDATPTKPSSTTVETKQFVSPKIYTPMEAIHKLLELKKSGDDSPLSKEFNNVYKIVSPAARLKYAQGKSDSEILETAEKEWNKLISHEQEPEDIKLRREHRIKIVNAIVNEFSGHTDDFIDVLEHVNHDFCFELKIMFEAK